MTAEMTVVQTDGYSWEPQKIKRIKLVADTEDALFGKHFRDHVNCYKYINSVSHRIEEPDMETRYRAWIKDVNNYAKNGGDMW